MKTLLKIILGLILLTVVFPMLAIILLDLAQHLHERALKQRIDQWIASGDAHIPLADLTNFEWNEVCQQRSYYIDGEHNPHAWDLNFFKGNEQKQRIIFDIEQYGFIEDTVISMSFDSAGDLWLGFPSALTKITVADSVWPGDANNDGLANTSSEQCFGHGLLIVGLGRFLALAQTPQFSLIWYDNVSIFVEIRI